MVVGSADPLAALMLLRILLKFRLFMIGRKNPQFILLECCGKVDVCRVLFIVQEKSSRSSIG